LAATFLVAVVCSLLHIAAFLAELNELALAAMLPMALFVLVAFGRMVIASGVGPASLRLFSRGNITGNLKRSREEISTILRKTPTSVKAGVVLVAAYCIFNFYGFPYLSVRDSAIGPEASSCLQNHPRFLCDDTESRNRAKWGVRSLSGYLVCFSLTVTAGFRYWVERRPWNASNPALNPTALARRGLTP
jgi:hypothetical protein